MTPKIDVISPLIALDHRLTLIQTRVLIALRSCLDDDKDNTWVDREKISDGAGGVSTEEITRTIIELSDLGWLDVAGIGGQKYLIGAKTPPEIRQQVIRDIEGVFFDD